MSHTPRDLDQLLRSIIKESVSTAFSTDLSNADDEEQRQHDLARKISNDTAANSKREVLVDEEESEEVEDTDKPSKAPEEEKVDLDIPAEIKFQDIRKQIDQIRSGKSLKDPETKLELVDYYDNLDEPERIALYKFLVSISKVLTKDVDGDSIPSLGQGKGKVVTKGKTKVGAPDPNKKKIARATKRAAVQQKKKVDKSSPDSEFSPPIKVGESQDKQDVLVEMLNSIV
jgi:hypothetical protein